MFFIELTMPFGSHDRGVWYREGSGFEEDVHPE